MKPQEVNLLPFLQPKKLAASIIAKRHSDGTKEEHKEDEHHPELMGAAEDMISAVHAKDTHKVASAMKRAHEHLNPKEQKE